MMVVAVTMAAAAAAAAAAAVAAAAEAMVPLRMILCLQIVRFPCFLKRRNGPTDLRTYGRTYGPTDRPSYRDARTHLKRGINAKMMQIQEM